MKNSQDEFIRGFLAATRLDALGTYISEQSVQLKKMLFDEILNSVLTNINIALPLRLYLCDTYDLFSRVFPVQMKGQGAVFYLLFDQHMEIINRIFNAIYLSEDDSGHDVWRLAYELFMESSMVGRNGLHSSYFGMNKLALGDYTSKKEWFSEENNFFSFVQSAFIMGHEIGHWICDVDKDERKAVNLNLKDKLWLFAGNKRFILNPFLYAPFDVPRYGLALLLCQRCHDCRDHLTGYLTGVNTLFLELNTDTEFFEFSDSRKAILCISGKSGNGLDQNPVDFSFAAILYHALKIFALFNRRAGNALIGIDIDHFPIRIAGDEFGIILILDAVGIELILAGGTDASIRCDAQLSRYDLVVRWDHNDARLF